MTVAVAVVAALLLVPGAGAALALAPPGRIAIETRIALAFGLGYGILAGVATLLAVARVFHLPTFVAAIVVATAAVWALALRRASLREHASALAGQAREAPFALAAGLALLLAVAVSRSFYSPRLNLGIAAPWRYWADGLEVAAAGRVPPESAQWGTEIPTTVSKVVLNSLEGGVSFLLGADPLEPMHGILSVVAVGLVAALLALGRELGLGLFAPLVPALSVLAPQGLPFANELAGDLQTFKAENMGRLAGVCALLLAMLVVQGRAGRVVAAVAGLLFGVAALTHLVAALVALAAGLLYALAVVLLDRSRLRDAVRAGAVVALVVGVSYVATLALAGGDLGFQRAAQGGGFQAFPATVDPTRSFAQARMVRRRADEESLYIPAPTLARTLVRDAVGAHPTARLGLVMLGALAIAALLVALLARPLVPLAVVACGLPLVLLAVGLFFSYRYTTWIPANFGPRRMYDYAALSPALLFPAGLEAIVRSIAGSRRWVLGGAALAAGALAVTAVVDGVPRDRSLPAAEAGLTAIDGVAEVVPCDGRLLVNARTAGSWEALTGRTAVTEGMAPYLRPEVLETVLPVVVGARQFFAEPAANARFLERQAIDYVIVLEQGVWVGSPAGTIFRETDAAAVASLPGLSRVAEGPNVTVYAVGPGDVAFTGQPSRCAL